MLEFFYWRGVSDDHGLIGITKWDVNYYSHSGALYGYNIYLNRYLLILGDSVSLTYTKTRLINTFYKVFLFPYKESNVVEEYTDSKFGKV